MYKKYFYYGIPAYIILSLFSIVFYKERSFFVDISFHLFYMIKDGTLEIQNFRFGAICTQLFPLIALKVGVSLKTMAIIYSLGFSMFYFIAYLLCGFVFKNYQMSLLLFFFNLLFVTHTFYWIQSELPQGITILIVILAYISHKDFNQIPPMAMALIFIGLFAVAFTHPLILFPFLYIIFYFLLDKKMIFQKRMLITLLCFYICMVILKNIVFQTAYEKLAMNGAHNFISMFPHYFNLYSNKRFLKDISTIYFGIPVLSLLVIIHYTKNKDYRKLILFILSMIAYTLLINISYPDKNTTAFYLENLYLPLAIFIAIPFIFDVMPMFRSEKIAQGLIVLILLTGCMRIFVTHNLYTARLNWERNELQKYQGRKVIINESTVPMDTVLMSWATPYEFWLLSTIENNQTASILINANPNQFKDALKDGKAFLTTWGKINYTELPSKYFIFKDTITNYNILQ